MSSVNNLNSEQQISAQEILYRIAEDYTKKDFIIGAKDTAQKAVRSKKYGDFKSAISELYGYCKKLDENLLQYKQFFPEIRGNIAETGPIPESDKKQVREVVDFFIKILTKLSIYTYYLPEENNQAKIQITENNSVVIIGANGSGKSKLGAWIEQDDMEGVHRIVAQRNLNFQENIPLKNYKQAKDMVFYGAIDPGSKKQKSQKYNYGKSYTTKLLDDFDDVLAAIIALKNNENDEYIKACKEAEKAGANKPDTTKNVIDKLIEIWDFIFPHRKLILEDAKFFAELTKCDNTEKYSSTQMSDGERAALYLISQVLCVPKNKTLIIDEPEVHLHRSIMNRLWQTLENYRPDCLFIYITHDTQFAAMHRNSDKIWIKEFDGKNWQLAKIDNSDIPEDLLLDILGNRKNVLFVEGDSNSYDTKLYQELYPDYYVVPCGSCTQVILRTKAFNKSTSLHHCEVYGVIDKDYRCEYELESLKKDNIFALKVAEVESLFVTPKLISVIAQRLGKDEKVVLSAVNDKIRQFFNSQLDKQICQSVVADLKYKLASVEISNKNDNQACISLKLAFESLDYESIKTQHSDKFNAVLTMEYDDILAVFNEKSILSQIDACLGLKNKEYPDLVLRLLKTDYRETILQALRGYLPEKIPSQCLMEAAQ